MERLTRRYTRRIGRLLGPERDIPRRSRHGRADDGVGDGYVLDAPRQHDGVG